MTPRASLPPQDSAPADAGPSPSATDSATGPDLPASAVDRPWTSEAFREAYYAIAREGLVHDALSREWELYLTAIRQIEAADLALRRLKMRGGGVHVGPSPFFDELVRRRDPASFGEEPSSRNSPDDGGSVAD